MPSLCSRNLTLATASKNHTKLDINFFFCSNIAGFFYLVPNILPRIANTEPKVLLLLLLLLLVLYLMLTFPNFTNQLMSTIQ